jgi:hypothetical protein
MAKISNVGVHNLSPGMVTTELLMSGANTPTAKFFINCLGAYIGCFAKSILGRFLLLCCVDKTGACNNHTGQGTNKEGRTASCHQCRE